MLKKLLLEDERLGLKIYAKVKSSKFLTILAEILSLSGDEIFWYGLSAGVGCFLAVLRGFGHFGPMGCVEEAMWDCFGACSACIFFESMLKLFFKRVRPTYAKQSENYVVHGEWFSFPSGHAMRAFYAMFWFSNSHFVALLSPLVTFPRARYLIPWAAGVGAARVAKGRHYPLDVAVGALIGSLIGYLVEDRATAFQRGIIKSITGTYVVFNWGYYCVVPLVTGTLKVGAEDSPFGRSKVATFIAYCAFAVMILLGTLAPTYGHVGAQTIERTDGSTICKTWW